MPNTMPGNTMRGKLIEEIESWVSNASPAEIQTLMTELVNGLSIRRVAEGRLDYPTLPYDLDHVDSDWLSKGPGPGWWGNYEVDDVVRIGMWTALDAARGGAPLFIVWVCAGAHCEVHVLPSPAQVTMLILTPAENKNPPESRPHVGGPTGPEDLGIIISRRKFERAPKDHGMKRSPLNASAPQSTEVEIYHPRK